MKISLQGFDHFSKEDKNNQDFCISTSKFIAVFDGCSQSKYSELGNRLFGQLFLTLPDYDDVDKFEENVENTFNKIIGQLREWLPQQKHVEEFVSENFLFTIIACFNMQEEFIVKMVGDGYIITQNMTDKLSYIKFRYDKTPPYFAYRYCPKFILKSEHPEFLNLKFKEFRFSKKRFKNVGVATDGILPIVESNDTKIDENIMYGKTEATKFFIRSSRQDFSDDVSLVIFNNGGMLNG